MRDIITIGSATRDVFLLSDHFKLMNSHQFETGVGECVPLGSKIEIEEKIESTGGGATNAAVTFSRLGFSAAIVARVGNDAAGREVLADLVREKIDTSLVRTIRKGETGYSTLLTAQTGERSVLVYRGVSADFTSADIPWHDLSARWLYITSLAGNLALVKRLAEDAAKHGAAVAWNPGHSELAKGLASFRAILPFISLLLVNREEAAMLTHEDDPTAAYHMLSRIGAAGTVVITDGDKGAYAFRRDGAWKSSTTGAPAISRTGAGDAFGSGLVAALLKGFPLPTALAIGTLNAESVVSHVGAKKGILKKWPRKAQIAHVKVREIK